MREVGINRLQDFETNLGDINYLVYKNLFAALRHAATYANGDLLDIGCGNKPYKEMFDVSAYYGCDIVQSSDSAVDVICDSLEIPIQNESFDTILSTQVIEHVPKPQKVFSEAFRLLRKSGVFIVSGPMYWKLHEEPHDFYRFTEHGFRHLLEDNGFEVVEIIPNGGKWALCGLVLMHTISEWRFYRNSFTKILNRIFERLDAKNFDRVSTSNYVVIARKP